MAQRSSPAQVHLLLFPLLAQDALTDSFFLSQASGCVSRHCICPLILCYVLALPESLALQGVVDVSLFWAGAGSDAGEGTKFHMPQGLNIAYNRRAAAAAAATGLEALPHMGEILPLGGQSQLPTVAAPSAHGKSSLCSFETWPTIAALSAYRKRALCSLETRRGRSVT